MRTCCRVRHLAAVIDRSGEPHSLLGRADPAPLTDLKWLQLTGAVKCKGGDRVGVDQTSLLTDLKGGEIRAHQLQPFSISSRLITNHPYGDNCHCDHSKLALTAGSAAPVFQSHGGTHKSKTRRTVFSIFNTETIF